MKTIKLTSGHYAMVDDADYEWLSRYRWEAITNKTNYLRARSRINGRNVYMHRLILGIEDRGILVDHIDRNALNNQRHNLRLVSARENQYNTVAHRDSSSRFKGVVRVDSKHGVVKWAANIKVNGKCKYLGTYNTESEAAKAYNEWASMYHGEFALLNPV